MIRFAFLALLLAGLAARCQTVTIPANSMTFTGVVNGTAISLTGPSTAVNLTISGGTAGLPSGMTYTAAAGLTVTGPVTSTGVLSGTQLALTSGPTLPTCSTELYIYQYTPATNLLTPVCLPPITVSQTAPGGPITITP